MAAMVTSDDPRPASTRVLLVDDEALMRAGLRLMIDGDSGIDVIGEAADGHEGVDQARDLQPDVILMDVRMPRMDGIEAVRALREAGSQARVVMLTAFDTDEFLLEALRAGAVSFLLKDTPPDQVVEAVLDAAQDKARFSPDVLARLVRLAATGTDTGTGTGTGTGAASEAGPTSDEAVGDADPSAAPPPEGITEREWEVGRLVARGLTNQEIGQQLFLSLATVKTHLGRLFDKLQVTNRVQLAIRVLELGG